MGKSYYELGLILKTVHRLSTEVCPPTKIVRLREVQEMYDLDFRHFAGECVEKNDKNDFCLYYHLQTSATLKRKEAL